MRLACSGLSSWFEKKATVVTPSRTMAAIAAQQFAASQLDQGRFSWPRPAIYRTGAWLAASWLEARYSTGGVPALLSPAQERALWQRIIEEQQPELFDIGAAAGLAYRARNILAEWHVPSEGEFWNDQQDAQHFQHWSKLFEEECRARGWITRSDVWDLLPKWIANGLCCRETIVFAGFERLSPALDRVRQVLGSLAVIAEIRSGNSGQSALAKCFADVSEELEHAARVARWMFEQQPRQSIAVLVPELASNRVVVEHTFQSVFYIEREADCIFHIDAASPLHKHPLVSSALLLLELERPRLNQADACSILRCPFLTGAAAERSSRALAELELRSKRELDVTLRDMEHSTKNCPVLVRVWPAVRRVLRDRSALRELSAWSEFAGNLVKAAGWPGDAELTAQEQKVVAAWEDALSGLAALGLVTPPVPFDGALRHLRRLLADQGVTRGDWSSPIQILDASDAAGLEFDRAIITGLSDETWPPSVSTSPLVPVKLQRACGVPGSSPESVREERKRATRLLFAVAPVVIATYSDRLSPVAQPFVRHDARTSERWEGKLPRESYPPASLDELEDSNAPRYEAMEPTRGGTTIIKLQSLCPFRAFAEMRLRAESPEDACFGFDSRDRGGFVHKALQYVWQQLETLDRLRSISPEELRTLVKKAIAQAVDDRSSPFYELASQTERDRLEELILDWLRLERQRKQPFTVETIEEKRYYDAAGLHLSLRVDRIDRLKNGNVVLIDYKSGKQSREKLRCPRPAEPQLLVYAAPLGNDVDGVFFGELKPRDLRAVGFSREKHFPGNAAEVRKDWPSFLEESRAEVERIATEFVAGYAAVDPVHHACEYCRMKPICRVNEKPMEAQEEE